MNVEIRSSPIHGIGVFACSPIQADDFQFVYGMLIPVETSYCIEWYTDDVFFEPFPPFRFINHSDNPNCEFMLDEDDTTLYVAVLCDIAAGEELTVNYGYNPTEEDDD